MPTDGRSGKKRVVLDTNALISATFWEGNPGSIVEMAERGEVELVLSWAVLEEVEEVLNRPYFQEQFQGLQSNLEQVLQKLIQLSVGPIFSETDVHVISQDPDDDKVLECAVDGEADVIVSGESHLLDLGEYAGIKILSPNEFLRRFEE